MTAFHNALSVLVDGHVEFVLIDGAAAIAHGSPRVTQDIDVVYRRTAGNIERLAAALRPHRPYLRGVPPGLPFTFDAETIRRGLNFTLVKDVGDLDLLGEAVGGGTYEALVEDALDLTAFGTSFKCVTLEKLIRLKRAAGRPKDSEAIAELELLADEKAH